MSSSLVSYARREIHEHIPGLQISDYVLPATNGSIPVIVFVNDSFYYKHDLEGRGDKVHVPSEQIVESLVRMHTTSQLAYDINSHPALIAFPGLEVTLTSLGKEHLDKVNDAKKKQINWFVKLVKMADDDWMRAKNHQMISNIQRTACEALKLHREWMIDIPDEMAKPECQFCGSGLLNPDAPVCPVCKQVINQAKFAELSSKPAKELVGKA